ncbi:MAG: hypothetical protein IT380_01140 [Myxococcales bacterium]|nr:hypothetical protein [Myxococcales bacterium]
MRTLPFLALAAALACSSAPAPVEPLRFTAVTINTGTTESQPWTPDSGYGAEQAAISDRLYASSTSITCGATRSPGAAGWRASRRATKT